MEPNKKDKPILSASKINKFLDCSWAYYCTYVLKLPDETHPKTHIGTLVHLILEILSNKRYKRHYDTIVKNHTVYASKRIEFIIKAFQKRYNLSDELIRDVDDLVFVALSNDFNYEGATKIFDSEFEFNLDLGKVCIRGFIDRMAEYDDKFKVRDYKTAKKKFTEEELKNNIQASVYQLAIYKIHGKKAEVEFNFVRHKKKPLCICPPKDFRVLDGFLLYLNHLGEQMSAINETSAKNNMLGTTDAGFCRNVCKFKDPFNYYKGLDADKKIIATSKNINDLQNNKKVVSIEKAHYSGCPFFYEK